MPALLTEAASARKISGNNRPKPMKPSHGAWLLDNTDNDGRNTSAVSALVAT